jgi:hypothetical protein
MKKAYTPRTLRSTPYRPRRLINSYVLVDLGQDTEKEGTSEIPDQRMHTDGKKKFNAGGYVAALDLFFFV